MAKHKSNKRYDKCKASNTHLKGEIKKVRKQRDYLEKRVKEIKGKAEITIHKVHS